MVGLSWIAPFRTSSDVYGRVRLPAISPARGSALAPLRRSRRYRQGEWFVPVLQASRLGPVPISPATGYQVATLPAGML